jgi:hypothetical protein
VSNAFAFIFFAEFISVFSELNPAFINLDRRPGAQGFPLLSGLDVFIIKVLGAKF